MYIPPHFQESRPEELEKVLQEHPLGTLIYTQSEGLDATHIPFVYKKDAGSPGRLYAHVARKNAIWQQVAQGAGVLVIFQGPEAYISFNWYPSKHETHKMVPTWNYQVVHVRGKIRFVEDPKILRGWVALLTHEQEARAQESTPWKMSDGDKDHIAHLLNQIVGVEIEITQITGATKMSQNRESRDKAGVINALRERGDAVTADAVEKGWTPGEV